MSFRRVHFDCCFRYVKLLLGLLGIKALYVLFGNAVFGDKQTSDVADLVALDEYHQTLFTWARCDGRAGRYPMLTPIKLYSAIT